MKRTLLSLFVLFSFSVSAQKEADRWYFGQNAGAAFGSGTAVALTNGAMQASEGCATISDASGNLLFYTDGITVWNRNHAVMTGGTGLMGGLSSTQAALIVPRPGSNTLYYVFTTDESGSSNGFRYSTVDMSLSGGLGSVVTKNTLLLTSTTEKLTAVKIAGGSDYWVLMHEFNSNAFNAYRVSSSGVGAAVRTTVGIKHRNNMIQNAYGQMKFSPCGDKVALSIGYQDTVQVFSFNDQTGVVSNPITIRMFDHVYGLEFSESGQRLYVSCYDPSSTLQQFDLSLGTQAAIVASRTTLSTTSDIYGLQLSNDGKVYAAKSFNQFLGVVNSPNVAGTGCNYNDFGLDLDPNATGLITTNLSLTGFVQSYFRKSSCVTAMEEASAEMNLTISPNPSSGTFNLMISPFDDLMMIDVYNTLGELVDHQITKSSQPGGGQANHHIDLSAEPEGIYFITLQVGNKSVTRKLAVAK